mmetsp:Transcript_7503/g.19336  ORF Transcript_7503/g.19336 Transcript_7503/m.19336 type:complete len:241 (-) Transcript_7503:736-1458(-)
MRVNETLRRIRLCGKHASPKGESCASSLPFYWKVLFALVVVLGDSQPLRPQMDTSGVDHTATAPDRPTALLHGLLSRGGAIAAGPLAALMALTGLLGKEVLPCTDLAGLCAASDFARTALAGLFSTRPASCCAAERPSVAMAEAGRAAGTLERGVMVAHRGGPGIARRVCCDLVGRPPARPPFVVEPLPDDGRLPSPLAELSGRGPTAVRTGRQAGVRDGRRLISSIWVSVGEKSRSQKS